MAPLDNSLTKLISDWQKGDRVAEAKLFERLYSRLHAIAVHCLRSEQNVQSLNATALVHEAYVKFRKTHDVRIINHGHFLALAARIMTNLIVDRARARHAARRGGSFVQVEWDDEIIRSDSDADEILMVAEAMERLRAQSPRQARLVELRYFAGFTDEESALALSLSPRHVRRLWDSARVRLRGNINGTP